MVHNWATARSWSRYKCLKSSLIEN